MAPVQQQLLPKPAEDPEIQQLIDELLDLSIATDELDEDAEHQMMELDGDLSEETEDAREPPMESSLSREYKDRRVFIPLLLLSKLLETILIKRYDRYTGTFKNFNHDLTVFCHQTGETTVHATKQAGSNDE